LLKNLTKLGTVEETKTAKKRAVLPVIKPINMHGANNKVISTKNVTFLCCLVHIQ